MKNINMWVLILACVLVSLLALLFLFSLRKAFSIGGKHVMVRMLCAALYLHHPSSPPLQSTGGSSGIGKSLAAEAIKRGAAIVTLVARNEVDFRDVKKIFFECGIFPRLVCKMLKRSWKELFPRARNRYKS